MTIPTATVSPDNCTNCLTPGHAVKVFAYLVRPDGEDSVKAHYVCFDCGAGWTTNYLLSALSGQAEASEQVTAA